MLAAMAGDGNGNGDDDDDHHAKRIQDETEEEEVEEGGWSSHISRKGGAGHILGDNHEVGAGVGAGGVVGAVGASERREDEDNQGHGTAVQQAMRLFESTAVRAMRAAGSLGLTLSDVMKQGDAEPEAVLREAGVVAIAGAGAEAGSGSVESEGGV